MQITPNISSFLKSNGKTIQKSNDTLSFIRGIKLYRQFTGTAGKIQALAKSGQFGSVDVAKSIASEFARLGTTINLALEKPNTHSKMNQKQSQ